MFPIPEPKHMPCPECGESVARNDREAHSCEDERWLDYQMFQLRDEVAALESSVAEYLDSPKGRFEVFYAALKRRRRP